MRNTFDAPEGADLPAGSYHHQALAALVAALVVVLVVSGCTSTSVTTPSGVHTQASSPPSTGPAPLVPDSALSARAVGLLHRYGWHPVGEARVSTVTVELNNIWGSAVVGDSRDIGLKDLKSLVGVPLVQYEYAVADRSRASSEGSSTGRVLFRGERLVGAYAMVAGYRGPQASLNDRASVTR